MLVTSGLLRVFTSAPPRIHLLMMKIPDRPHADAVLVCKSEMKALEHRPESPGEFVSMPPPRLSPLPPPSTYTKEEISRP